jgi:macrolide transport system ATP-binding/permease protein
MRLLARLRLRVRSLLLRARVEQELDEELRYHLEREIEEGLAAGLPRDEARLRALRDLGAVDRAKEECRDMRGVTFVEHRIQDLHFAWRQLRRRPVFGGTVAFVLALGLSANVAIFGFVDAALVRPLPYRDSGRLVTAFATRAEEARTRRRGNVSYQDFRDWRERTRAFAAMGAYDVRTGLTLFTAEGPDRVPALSVSAGFFETLGVAPVLGRTFRADEEGPAASPVVMLSFAAWQARFGGRPDVLGQTVRLRGFVPEPEPHVIVGVLPRDFHFALAAQADFWTTIRGRQYCWGQRGCRSLEAIGRLAPGVSREAAASALTASLLQVRAEHPAQHTGPEIAKLVPLREVMLGDVRPVLLALSSGAALLLLIACINVISLLLARSDGRAREIGVRSALGASSGRLALQFATEAAVLTAVGAAIGLLLAAGGLRLLQGLVSADMASRMPYLQGIAMDGRLVGFAAGLSLLAATVFTVTPIVWLRSPERLARARQETRGSSGTTWRRFGSSLVMAELAVALVLLVSAGLLGKSLGNLLHVDVGLDATRLAVINVNPSGGDVGQSPGLLAREVADRVAALPGVEGVAYADLPPLSAGLAPTSVIYREGADTMGREDHPVRQVSAGYFAALQARLVRGRDFTPEEVATARRVAILNEAAARRYLPGLDPIGRQVVIGRPPAREVVGVVADIKDGPLETPTMPAAYVPFDQPGFGLIVRARPDDDTLFPRLSAAIREVRPGLIVFGEITMVDRIHRLPLATLQRSSAWLARAFAALAFVLSVVGLYGVIAYSVGQRRREIGVRMALGARRQTVQRMVLGEAARLVVVGTVTGLLAAGAAASLMRRLLFDVQPWDGPTMATAAAVLGAAALLAAFVPARRAASVNPIEVLRTD